ncbi:helix-turn-helix domain-containing protein [Clostridium culturomicium]|uniref:helix-turn-helix domain-containing protein n=1 Tax=Clostridium culturomicium TaxID=1499683 RepID=UPI00058DE5BF|nr:helix-turn-helix transcriptional regulator [Clostridium culturomicium]
MNKIKEFRVKNKITIRQLSEKTGVAVGYISTLENDKNGTSNPTKDVMIRIANGLGHTVPEVFF